MDNLNALFLHKIVQFHLEKNTMYLRDESGSRDSKGRKEKHEKQGNSRKLESPAVVIVRE